MQPPRATKYGRKECFEEDHLLRKLLAAVLVVGGLVIVLTMAALRGIEVG